MSDVRIALPEPRPEDDEDVVWGLSTATALWSRGEIQDALVWLRRAADAANAAGQSFRASELGMYVAEIEDALTQVTVASAPVAVSTAATDDIDDTISEEPTNALGERGLPVAAIAPRLVAPPAAPALHPPLAPLAPPIATQPASAWPDDEATLVRSPKTSQPPGPLAVMPPSPFETTLPSASSPFAHQPAPPPAPPLVPQRSAPPPPAPPVAAVLLAPPPAHAAPPPAAAPTQAAPRPMPTATPPMGSPLVAPPPPLGSVAPGAFPAPSAPPPTPPAPPAHGPSGAIEPGAVSRPVLEAAASSRPVFDAAASSRPVLDTAASSRPVSPQAPTTLPAPAAPRAPSSPAPVAAVSVAPAPQASQTVASPPAPQAAAPSPTPPVAAAPAPAAQSPTAATTEASDAATTAKTTEPSSPPGRKEPSRRGPILDPWAEAEPQRTPGFLTRREQKGAELTADGESVLVSVRAWRSSDTDDDVVTSAKPLDSLEQRRKSGKAKAAEAKPPPPPPKSGTQPSRPAAPEGRPAPPPPPPPPPASRSAPAAQAESRPKPPPPTPSARPAPAKPAEPRLPGKLGGANDGLIPKLSGVEAAATSEPAPATEIPPTAPATDVTAATFDASPPAPVAASPSPPPPVAASPSPPPPPPLVRAEAPAPPTPPPPARPASVAPKPLSVAPATPAPAPAPAAPAHAPRRRLPSEPEIPASARSVAGVVLDRIDAFSDLPQEVQMRLASAARIEHLAAEEEVSSFGAALVVDGEGHVCATIVDAPAHHARAGSIVPTQGTLGDGVALRVVAGKSGATVAVWEADVVDDALKACPWASDDLRDRADRLQALAGATLGPLGDLDEAYRQQIVERLAVRVVAAHEVLIRQNEHGMAFFIVGAGEIEICDGDPPTPTGEAGPGDVLFAGAVIAGGPAPATARAGASGAVVLVGDRKVTQELLVTVPALLELLG